MLAMILVLILAWFFYSRTSSQRLPERADLGGLVNTIRLDETITELQKNLASPYGNSGKTTAAYISLLSGVVDQCKLYSSYARNADRIDSHSDVAVYLAKSVRLCDELSPLATDSRMLYRALEPVMQISPKMRRYQTISFLQTRTRESHLKKVAGAFSAVNAAVSATNFDSRASEEIRQLEQSIRSSKKLSYGQPLKSFQVAMLAERQQYWTNYVEINNLRAALKTQIKRYCALVPPADRTSYASCREQNNTAAN